MGPVSPQDQPEGQSKQCTVSLINCKNFIYLFGLSAFPKALDWEVIMYLLNKYFLTQCSVCSYGDASMVRKTDTDMV